MLAAHARIAVLLVAAAGCGLFSPDPPADAGPDGESIIMFEPFTSGTWSLSSSGGAAQLSITDGTGAAACALSTDHQHSLGAAGVQIIFRLAEPVTDTCPGVHHPVTARCPPTLGSMAYVPAGCAFFRRWDAQGNSLGITAAINGEVTFSGDASSCSIRANIGFFGGSFAETFTLRNGASAQPWCGS